MNSQNTTNLGFFQEVLSYVDEFQLNKLDLALSNKKHTTKNAIRFSYQKKTPRKTKNKARPLNAWMVGSKMSFLPSFWGRFGLFSRGKLAAFSFIGRPTTPTPSFRPVIFLFPGACFLGGSPKKSDTKNLRVDNTQQFNRSNGYNL